MHATDSVAKDVRGAKRKALNHDTANLQQVNYDGLQILVTETAQVQSTTNQEPNP
jgi:hypothetical protein